MTALRTPFKPGFDATEAATLADTLKALAEPARLAILALLKAHGSLSVSQLTELLPLSQPTVSHHLGILGDAGLVDSRREGVFIYRSLNVERMRELSGLLNPGRSK